MAWCCSNPTPFFCFCAKVFISEQKLYNRSQLRQHISSGDSEVDGNESERGGFAGHPVCEFCRNPFYGDTELYMHMSTEHYICHICQRQHPGQYDYYRNYDDLEVHFRQEHFLCEHEACLAKKFVVFQSEAEMKRHNAIEHGGHLSRSKRNAALQIPVSFRYRGSAAQNQGRGRWRGFHAAPSQSTIHGGLEMADADGRLYEPSSGNGITNSERGEANQYDMIASSVESLAISSHSEEISSMSDANNTQSYGSTPAAEEISFPPISNFEPPELSSSRYVQVLNQGSSARLGEASFPPLPGVKDSVKPIIAPVSEGLAANTIAARLKLHNKGSVKVLHSARLKASQNYAHGPSSSVTSLEMRPQTRSHGPATSTSNSITGDTANQVVPPISSASPQASTTRGNGFAASASIPISSVWNSRNLNRVRHSASATALSTTNPSNTPLSNKTSSATLNQELPTSIESLQHVQNVQTANKSLVESIRAGLGMDEEKYAAFKTISTEYRQDKIDSWEYLSYVEQFGLSHLVLELAQLCPDSRKQQLLIDAYNANLCNNGLQENNRGKTVISNKDGKKPKGKGKAVDLVITPAKDALADNTLDQEVGVLSKDGYNNAKDQDLSSGSIMIVDYSSSERKTITTTNSDGEGGKKNRKIKFHRLPLGNGNAHWNPERTIEEHCSNEGERLHVRGVWHNGGGKRLFSQSHA
ncbi:E3 ubiquitin-protein ligase hel2-like isoform X2 [Dendrobium catenatum]|uniref:E3 ubiquitin-protein ligase hel2-like isoform X2 n=1 Tax=Dendrobium catenatum TaxID=906689 RepID=UPI00109F7CAA|nr:E3 ubiquitin-protein ligase hel2-like isoform X2 [Dendrobium catenatum]